MELDSNVTNTNSIKPELLSLIVGIVLTIVWSIICGIEILAVIAFYSDKHLTLLIVSIMFLLSNVLSITSDIIKLWGNDSDVDKQI